jgi:hypothetical protein
MRTWGRVWYGIQNVGGFVIYNDAGQPILPSGLGAGRQYPIGQGSGRWVKVETDPSGNNDLVFLTTLCQAILLNLNESPVYSDVGLPARQSVLTGVAPDYNMSLLQRRFAPFFQSLTIAKTGANPPSYLVNVITHQGVKLSAQRPIPT